MRKLSLRSLIFILTFLSALFALSQFTHLSASTLERVSAQASGDPVFVGAGDIADCSSPNDEKTANLLDRIDGTVFTAGDNAYSSGTTQEFNNCYHPSWGRHKARTRPATGNHDHKTVGAKGYFSYFGAQATGGTDCSFNCQSYYSYNLGSWHIIVLDSEIAMNANSAQQQWLRADLSANSNVCTIAIWHRPLFSSGDHSNQTQVKPLWETLYANGVDIVLNGHDHNYERFAPQDPNGKANAKGIRQFVVGTGGKSLRPLIGVKPNSEARNANTYGVLKLILHAGSYDWEFIPVAGQSFNDQGSGICVGAGDTPINTPTQLPTQPPTKTPTPVLPPTDMATPTPTDTPVADTTPEGEQPVLLQPRGQSSQNPPVFRWQGVPGATLYELWVNQYGDLEELGKIWEMYTPQEAHCDANLRCQVSPNINLLEGVEAEWWITAYLAEDVHGNSDWNESEGVTFVISGDTPPSATPLATHTPTPTPTNVSVPPTLVLIAPKGTSQTNPPTFRWQAVAGAVAYSIWANQYGKPNIPGIIDQKYTPAQANCSSGGICSVSPGIRFATGEAQWWLTAYLADGTEIGCEGVEFTVDATSPPSPTPTRTPGTPPTTTPTVTPLPNGARPVLFAPQGMISSDTPSFSWQKVAGAVRYQLWVNEYGDPNEIGKIDASYTPAQANCATGSLCRVNPAVKFAAAEAEWWVVAYFSDESSAESVVGSFTVQPARLVTPVATAGPTERPRNLDALPTPTPIPLSGCAIAINHGEGSTAYTQVTLYTNLPGAQEMAFVNSDSAEDLAQAQWQIYQPSAKWMVADRGEQISTQTVYARFRNSQGLLCNGATLQDSILYDPLPPTILSATWSGNTLQWVAQDQANGSGVLEVAISERPDFADTYWKRYKSEEINAQANTLYLRVRDAAGNVSATFRADKHGGVIYLPLAVR